MGSSGSQARTGPVGRRVHSPASVRGAPKNVQVGGDSAGRGMQRHESRFRGVKVKSCGRLRLPHRSNSQISLLQPAFLFCLQRRNFFRYFYFTDTRVRFSSLNFPIFILFSAFLVSRSFGKTHKESIYNKKVAFFLLFVLASNNILATARKNFPKRFLSSRDEPACFTKLNSRFFWLERKNIKIFGPHRIASCCIIVLLV